MPEQDLDTSVFLQQQRDSLDRQRDKSEELQELQRRLDEVLNRQKNGEKERFLAKLEAARKAAKRRRDVGESALPGVRPSGRQGSRKHRSKGD